MPIPIYDCDFFFYRPSSNDRKYIVYETQLLELFKTCSACSSPALVEIKQVVGSMVKIQQSCGLCNFNRVWESQPYAGAIPAGNLLISCAILFSGMHNVTLYTWYSTESELLCVIF